LISLQGLWNNDFAWISLTKLEVKIIYNLELIIFLEVNTLSPYLLYDIDIECPAFNIPDPIRVININLELVGK